MEHILNDILSQHDPNFQGLDFGFTHTCIMLIGYYTGFSINRFSTTSYSIPHHRLTRLNQFFIQTSPQRCIILELISIR